MRIAILGASASGKEVQAKSLAARYRVPHISPHILLRAAADGDGGAGDSHPPQVAAASDEAVIALLDERLRARDCRRGFIIDGFPGNIPQAQALDTLLGMFGRTLQIAIHVELDDDTLAEHLGGHLQCTQCGAAYHLRCAPPKIADECDVCGGELAIASGDLRAAVAEVRAYREQIAPLLAYYKAQHKLRTVLAVGEAEEIRQKICAIVDLEMRPLEMDTLETAAQTLDEETHTIIAGGQISRITPSSESASPPPRKPAGKPPTAASAVSATSAAPAEAVPGK